MFPSTFLAEHCAASWEPRECSCVEMSTSLHLFWEIWLGLISHQGWRGPVAQAALTSSLEGRTGPFWHSSGLEICSLRSRLAGGRDSFYSSFLFLDFSYHAWTRLRETGASLVSSAKSTISLAVQVVMGGGKQLGFRRLGYLSRTQLVQYHPSPQVSHVHRSLLFFELDGNLP